MLADSTSAAQNYLFDVYRDKIILKRGRYPK
jgi:hypothetical protein